MALGESRKKRGREEEIQGWGGSKEEDLYLCRRGRVTGKNFKKDWQWALTASGSHGRTHGEITGGVTTATEEELSSGGRYA